MEQRNIPTVDRSCSLDRSDIHIFEQDPIRFEPMLVHGGDLPRLGYLGEVNVGSAN